MNTIYNIYSYFVSNIAYLFNYNTDEPKEFCKPKAYKNTNASSTLTDK